MPLALALTLAAPAAIATPAPVQGDMAQVQRHLAALSSMTADFEQTDRNGKVLTGTMTLKRPGKIRFQYEQGVPYLIVSDGKSLYFIDYSVKQVERWPVGGSPLGILLDPGKDISRIAKLMPTSDPSILSVEVHDPDHPEYGRITLIFQKDSAGPAGLRLLGWVALDSQNNRTTIRLSKERFDVAVADNMFRWRDPRAPGRPNR